MRERPAPGQMIAVLGPVACGTSAFCRDAAELTDGSHGESRHPGDALMTPAKALLGDDPDAQLTGLTSYVGDEIQLPLRLRGAPPEDAARTAASAASALGIGDVLGRRLDALSGGERQMVALAATMTLRPRLIILDQPTLSLDAGARRLLLAALSHHCTEGGSVLVAAHHYDELAAAAHRVLFLDHGRVIGRANRGDVTAARLRAAGVWASVATPVAADCTSTSPEAVPGTGDVNSASGQNAGQNALLTVRSLAVFRGVAPVLDRVDLGLRAGEVVAVTGPNGSGKSTLLRALAGVLDRGARVRGHITFSGNDGRIIALDNLPAHQRAGRLAWVGQDPTPQLSAATVRTELAGAAPLPRRRRRDHAAVRAERMRVVDELMRRLDLQDAANTHPFDLPVARRRDVVLASALLLRPAVLLLDEPTLGRDLAGMERLTRVIRAFARGGGAVLAATHDLRWARSIADRSLELATHC